MSAKTVFSLAGIVTFLGGVGVILVPMQFLDPFGISLDEAGIHMARLNGATALALGALFWLVRNWTDWHYTRPVALCGFIAYLVAAVIAVASTITGVMNVLGWVNVVLDAALTLGFGYLLFIRKAA